MKTWLVTGGAGFIGCNMILLQMKQGGIRIVNLDKLTYAGNLESLATVMDHPDHIFVYGGIEDRRLVSELLERYRPDAVINFAAETHVDRSIDGPADFIQTNIVGTFELLEAVRDYWNRQPGGRREKFRFLQISTDEVYGSLGPGGFFQETTRYDPRSPYSASKASADHMVRAYHHTYGLPVLVTHCSNNYGPYQFPDKLIPLMLLNILEGKPLPVYGDGQHVRDWLYVEDHCRAIQTVLERGRVAESYNIGGNDEKTNLQVVHALCDLCDKLLTRRDGKSHREQIVLVPDRPGHDRRYAIDPAKIRFELGWQPEESLVSGLRKTVDWYLHNKEWCRRACAGKYGGERLGLGSRTEEGRKDD